MPDLPIDLGHQSRSLQAVGLVDSGAATSVLPYYLGLDLNTQMACVSLRGLCRMFGRTFCGYGAGDVTPS